MKKFISFIFVLFAICTLSACAKKYEVKFTSKDVLVETQKVKEGAFASEVELENTEDEIFIAWYNGESEYDFSTPVTSDLELVAKWANSVCNVVFKNDDGTILKTIKVNYGEQIVSPITPEKASDDEFDYEFKEWDKELGIATSDCEFVATYNKSIRKYLIRFFNEDNSINAEIKVEKGNKAGKITLSKEDDALYSYSFDGWYLEDGTKYIFNDPVTKDINLYPRFSATPHNFDTKNKTISIIGDSISSFYSSSSELNSYYTGTNEFYYPTYSSTVKTVDKTWWAMLANSLGAKIGVNNSLSGSVLTGSNNQAGMSDARINTLGENGNPDMIFIFMGTNDNASGVSANDFKNAYITTIDKIKTKYPNAYIFCFNLGYSNYHINLPDSHGKYSEETRLAYNEVIEDVCKAKNAILIDLASIQTIDTYNQFLGDNLHPQYYGMQQISSLAFSTVKNFFNSGKELLFVNYMTDELTSLEGEQVDYFYEGDQLQLPTASKEGYDFLGWYDNEEFEGKAIVSTEGFTSDMQLYPWFESKLADGEFRVLFKANGGLVGETDREVLMNDFLNDLSEYVSEINGTETVFTSIDEWGFTSTLEEASEDQPNKVTYTIKFDYSNMGSWQQVNIYNMLTLPKYTSKWAWLIDYINACAINNKAYITYLPNSPWQEPLTVELYAFFKGVEIKWDSNHTSADYSQPEILEESVSFAQYANLKAKAFSETVSVNDLPTPIKEGYTFVGWFMDEECTIAVTEINSNCEIYAKWQ